MASTRRTGCLACFFLFFFFFLQEPVFATRAHCFLEGGKRMRRFVQVARQRRVLKNKNKKSNMMQLNPQRFQSLKTHTLCSKRRVEGNLADIKRMSNFPSRFGENVEYLLFCNHQAWRVPHLIIPVEVILIKGEPSHFDLCLNQ